MIDVNNLEKRYAGRVVLSSLSLRVDKGEGVNIVGRNGSGKTTLLRVLASLVGFQSGYVAIGGYTLPAESIAVRRCVGFLSHRAQLYTSLTAMENLRFYNRLYALGLESSRLERQLERVGLRAWQDEQVAYFSRGMIQRLELARVIAAEPDVLLLDEPENGLDDDGLEILKDILGEACAQGRVIVMSSHRSSAVTTDFRKLVLESGMLHEGRARGMKAKVLDV